ncbi:transposase family protein [Sphingomonas sp. HH69]
MKARIGRISPKDLIKARDGAKAAADRFRPVTAEYSANHALEIVQIDHTLVDAIIVDERHRQPIGRPWLSLAIDVASRCVAGFYLTLEHPSAISVAMTMRHAVLPKENWLASLGIAAPWSSSGLPDLIHMDNAREFHGRALRRGCEQYGIGQHFRPIRTPHFGGHIERLIGTTMGAVHLLPGTTFSNVAEKADYRSEATAVMTLAELEQWLALEISGGYHARIHSALKRPPELAWQEMVARRPCALRYPPDAEQFLYDFLPFEHRIVRRDGIRLFNLHYWDPVLTALAGLCEEAMTVKYDPRNLSRVFLEAPDGSHWTIPYRDLRRPAITLFEHRQALRAMAERGRNSVNEQLIFDTVAAQRALIADATQRSKSARKSAQRIVNALTAPLPLMGEAEHSVTYGQDVEILSLPPYEVEER